MLEIGSKYDCNDLLFEELGYQEATSLETYNPGEHLVFPLPHVEQVYRVKGVPVAYFSRFEVADPTFLRQLHKNIWNESRVPLLYVVMPQQIRVYNTYATPAAPDEALDDETRLLEHLDGRLR